jgi:hypothetical protein
LRDRLPSFLANKTLVIFVPPNVELAELPWRGLEMRHLAAKLPSPSEDLRCAFPHTLRRTTPRRPLRLTGLS